MDAILSRVGDAELRQHCVDAVLEELLQADKQVQQVVSALERTLKVAQASRDVHKSLVLNASEQVQTSFRQLGESCNQIGPLLRLLHRNMSAVSSSTADQPATPTSSAAPTVSESKPAATASPTTSEYELSSDDEDDDPEVVEVTPPTRSKKRKATVDLSESTPVVRRKTLQEDTQTVRNRMATELQKIQVTPISGYTVARHKSLSSFVRSIFTAANEFHHWQPRDDPQMFQLLDEMKHRIGGFKDSCAQKSRRKAMDEWLQAMTASSFVPCLDLQSLPPKRDPRAASVEKCHGSLDLEALIKPAARMWNKLRTDTSSDKEKKQKYFQPLLLASTKFYAAVLATTDRGAQSNWASRCNDGLRALFQLAKGSSMTRKECAQLEELLYLVRLIMPKSKNFRKKALKLVPDLLALFPPSARPKFKNLELSNSKKKASS